MYNYPLFGSINMDWNIPWIDNSGDRINNASFLFNNGEYIINSGSYTNKSDPDPDNGGTAQPIYYNGTLENIYIYTSNNGSKLQTLNTKGNPVTVSFNYTTEQFGNYFFENNNYIYPNKDTFQFSDLYINNSEGDIIRIDNFSVNYNYNTKYYSNFNNNFKNKGVSLETNNYIKMINDTDSDYIYELYIGNSISIPINLIESLNLNTSFDLPYNIFLNKNSNAYINNEETYWKYFLNNYGNTKNTYWIILNIIFK